VQKNRRITVAVAALLLLGVPHGATLYARAQTPSASPYSAMAPLDHYLIPDVSSEIALARSAAPPSIAQAADVMVLKPTGYVTAVKGTNGFVCIVERGWAGGADFPDFWDPKLRAPHCFNAAAARTFLPIYLLKTKLALSGKSKPEILDATESAFRNKQLPELERGAMAYMMSKQQFLNEEGKSWHPHLMFYAPGDVSNSWGANLTGSPVIATNDPEEHATIFMVIVSHWSDGTPAPTMQH
jgi:hypothetical protein